MMASSPGRGLPTTGGGGLLLLLLAVCSTPSLGAQPGPEVTLFPAGRVPGERPNTFPPEKTGSRVSDVTTPTLTPYIVEGAASAVVICPGGAYEFLSWDLEGTTVAAWLNSLNISAFILKYRVPARKWLPFGGAPLMDAQRAMGLIRSNASAYGLNASSPLGIIGFSAGSHLSAHLATDHAKRSYPRVDAADDSPCRPDFVMLLYPWCVLGDNSNPGASCNADTNHTLTLAVTKETPSMFIVQAEDDPVHCDNALLLYLALKQARAPPSELHLYSQGGHGFGLCSHREDVCSWPRRAQQYLELRGLVAGDPRLDPPNPPPQKLDDEAVAAVDNRDLAAGSLIHTWDYSDQPCKCSSSSLCSFPDKTKPEEASAQIASCPRTSSTFPPGPSRSGSVPSRSTTAPGRAHQASISSV